MTLNPARRHSNWLGWLVSLLAIVAVWRFGVYGLNWTLRNSIVALLVAIAVLHILEKEELSRTRAMEVSEQIIVVTQDSKRRASLLRISILGTLIALPIVLVGLFFFASASRTELKPTFLLGAVLMFPALTWIGLLARFIHRKRSNGEQNG